MRTIKRAALPILLFGILLWKLCGISASAETMYEARFEQIVIAETVQYQNEAGDEIKTVPGAEEPLPTSAEIFIDLAWSGNTGTTFGPFEQRDEAWLCQTNNPAILDTHNLEQVTVRVTDNGQEYRAVLSGDALPTGNGQELLFDKLVLEARKTVCVETGTLEVAASGFGILGEVPQYYAVKVIPQQESNRDFEETLSLSTEGVDISIDGNAVYWTLQNLPVGDYCLMQESYGYDGCTVIPSVLGSHELQPGGEAKVQIFQGETRSISFLNDYIEGELGALVLDEQMDTVKEQDRITVTCRVQVQQYSPALFPSIQAYLQSEDGRAKLSPSSRAEGTTPSEPAVIFKFTLDETAAGSTWRLVLSGAPSSGDMFVTIPDFVSQAITIELQHHYGGGPVQQTVVKDAPGTLEDQWIKEQGIDSNTYSVGRKRAASWRLFDESGQTEITAGEIQNGCFSPSGVLLEAGKTYQLQIHYDTLYELAPYFETAADMPGAELMGNRHYLPQPVLQSYQSCAQVFDLHTVIKKYDGYHFFSADTEGQLAGGKILDDGSTHIKVYYDKDEVESSEASTSEEPQETSEVSVWRPSAAPSDAWDSHTKASEASHETASEAVSENDVVPSERPSQQSEAPDGNSGDLSVAAPPKTKGTVYRIAAVLAIGVLFFIILQKRKDD